MSVTTETPEAPAPQRQSRGALANATTGTVAGAIGQAASAMIVASNPELIVLAPIIGTAVTGVLSGVGAAARDRLASGDGGLWTFVARLFAWLG